MQDSVHKWFHTSSKVSKEMNSVFFYVLQDIQTSLLRDFWETHLELGHEVWQEQDLSRNRDPQRDRIEPNLRRSGWIPRMDGWMDGWTAG